MFFNAVVEVKSKIMFSKEFCYFVLSNPEIASQTKPGQFIHLKVSDSCYPILRRPISICDCDERENIEIFVKIVGLGTDILAAKQPGDKIEVMGPLGSSFRISDKKRHILLGGGVGMAPLIYLAKKLKTEKKDFVIFYGGRDGCQLPLIEKMKFEGFEMVLSTEDGSIGQKGLITDSLRKYIGANPEDNAYYICGPEKMMTAIAEIPGVKSGDVQVSLENRMACGVGACQGCAVQVTSGGYQRVCKEGPVFDLQKVIL